MPIDWSKPIQTVTGVPARLVCTDRATQSGHPYLILVMDNGSEAPFCCTREGTGQMRVQNIPAPLIQREFWVNIYPEDQAGICHPKRTMADISATKSRVACVPVTIIYREGEGL